MKALAPLLAMALAVSSAHADSLGDLFDEAATFVKTGKFVRTVTFSGLRWRLKSSDEPVGPGPNIFSDDRENVWVDSQKRLHLRITNAGGRWRCAEVVSERSFGYGTYRFTVEGAPQDLDPNAVLGLFTWSDDPADHNREIDVELSRWGQAQNPDTHFVVQPYSDPKNILRFEGPKGAGPVTYEFTWRPGRVDFASSAGARWSALQSVPRPGDENARMNLWLFQGKPPSDQKPVEVVISRFEFVPAP